MNAIGVYIDWIQTLNCVLIHGPVDGVWKVAEGIGVGMKTPGNGLHWCQYVFGRRDLFACKEFVGSRKVHAFICVTSLTYKYGTVRHAKKIVRILTSENWTHVWSYERASNDCTIKQAR